jgi:nucleotide-binding universal stress UspA family protein
MDFLVGYDNSKESEHVLDLAKKYAKAFNAKIHFLSSTSYGPELEATEYEEIKAALEKLKNDFQNDGIDCETHILSRSISPGEDLVDFAGRFSIDKIIIGSRKKSKIGILLLGSTAQYVVLEADCPVIIVK